MTSDNKKLLMTISISLFLIIIITVYSYKKYIKPKKSGNIVKVSKYSSTGKLLSTTTKEESPSSNPVLGFFIIFIAMIIIGLILYIKIMRYNIAYKSIEKGNTAMGIAALSPEISNSLKNLLN